jgi:hypothetical protein
MGLISAPERDREDDTPTHQAVILTALPPPPSGAPGRQVALLLGYRTNRFTGFCTGY